MTTNHHIVKVWRGQQSGYFQTYEVPKQKLQTVLDVVTHVQRELDSSLAYRFACRVGVCGTCAMTVNGIPRWTCRTQASVAQQNGEITIEPLSNFPVIRDLVVDMDPFFEKWTTAGTGFHSPRSELNSFVPVRPGNPRRREVDKSIECIGCGVCYAACDIVRWKPDYLGPAALNRAWTLVNDERTANKQEILNSVATDSGCLSCHTTQSCTRHCPKELDPSAAIAGLKAKTFARGLFKIR